MTATRVTVVCSNLSNNCLGRALLLADLAKPLAEVKVVGANLTRGDIWAPAAGFDVSIEAFELLNAFQYPRAKRWLRSKLRGSKVVVSKPLQTSLGLTRAAGVGDEQMLLDVDDWEQGLFSGTHKLRQVWDLVRPDKVNSFPTTVRLDATVTRCPQRTVSNSWLQDRFGGALLPHVRDTDVLQPNPAARQAARAELDMSGRFWVGFVGTLRAHKGAEDLLAAVARLEANVGLYLAGIDERDGYTAQMVAQVRQVLPAERVRLVKTFDFKQLSYWLGAADMLAIPSRASEAAAGQIPAKLFDAMAMGIPVVVSAINDMPKILDRSGQVITPGDVDALVAAIRRYRDDPQFRRQCGEQARARAISHYSYASARQTLAAALAAVPVFNPN
jgi:glycosyltransferase involved in cell wall biosynthesis